MDLRRAQRAAGKGEAFVEAVDEICRKHDARNRHERRAGEEKRVPMQMQGVLYELYAQDEGRAAKIAEEAGAPYTNDTALPNFFHLGCILPLHGKIQYQAVHGEVRGQDEEPHSCREEIEEPHGEKNVIQSRGAASSARVGFMHGLRPPADPLKYHYKIKV